VALWVTEKGPADFSWDADRSGARKGFTPSNGGTYLLVVDFPPVGPEVDKFDLYTMTNVVADAPKRGVPPSNPLMHRTRTVDYAIIMAGEIDMMLDTGTVHLKAGDVVVQQLRQLGEVDRHPPLSGRRLSVRPYDVAPPCRNFGSFAGCG
jgi:naringenin degradation protein FdeH